MRVRELVGAGLLLVAGLVACEQPPVLDGSVSADPIPADSLPEPDPSQVMTPLPAWRGWCYEGPATMRGAFAAAVSWWAANGRDLGPEGCSGHQIRIVDLSDREGPVAANGSHQSASVSYRGDAGADIRVYAGLLSYDATQLENAFRHELGHVIGLQHSHDSRCLMWGEGYPTGDLCDKERELLSP